MVKENEAKIDEADKTAVEEAADALDEVLKGEDLAAIEAKTEALNTIVQGVATKLYQSEEQPGGPAQGAPEAEQASDDEEVIDADYEVKN